MRVLKIGLVSLALICLVSCEYLGGCLYKVNEYKYLSIVFNDSKLSPVFLTKYVDSVRNKNLVIPDSIAYEFFKGDTIPDQERLLHFQNPDEWYRVMFNAGPCWVGEIYNPKLANKVINDPKDLSDIELKRIENRIRQELFAPAIKYGKAQHLPDSVIYNIKYH